MSERLPPTHADIVRWSFIKQGTLGEVELPEREPLGEGGQAFVLYGEYPDHRPCAVKIHQSADDDPDPIQRKASQAFRREAKFLEGFDHPNIIKMHDVGVHNRIIPITGPNGEQLEHRIAYDYIVMEYAEYGSVSDRIKRLGESRILPAAESSLILLQAAEGLRYAHAEQNMKPRQGHPVIHGDVKPANFMLTRGKDGGLIVKVADFGIARGGSDNVETELGTALHALSPFYASARQMEEGGARVIDDIYALGVTAYYLFTGEHPINPRSRYDADAHRTTIVRPMEPKLLEGKEIVEELNYAVLPVFQNGKPDANFVFPYSTMGDFQSAVKDCLRRAERRAAKDTTLILLNGTETTWPRKPEELLHAELLLQKDQAEDPASLFEVTTAMVNTPTNTEALKTRFGRRKLFLGASALAAGTVVAGIGGVWLDWFGKSAEQIEQDKLAQERQAITEFAYSALDFLGQNGRDADVPHLLRELIPYDPDGIIPRIERVAVDLNDTEEAETLSHLVPYRPEVASEKMQQFIGSYGNLGGTMRIAMQLASYAQSPAGKGGNWQAKVQEFRDKLDKYGLTDEAKQDAYHLLDAASNPRDASSLDLLKEHSQRDISWAIEALGTAIAPFNPAGVAEVLDQRIDVANSAIGKNLSALTFEANYGMVELLARGLAPYAADAVAKSMMRIDVSGVESDRANDAQANVAVGLAPYKPEATIAYIKGDGPGPDDWQTHRWNMASVISLTKADPHFVHQAQPTMSSEPYREWIEVGLNPLDAAAKRAALAVLPEFQGLYIPNVKYMLDALLRSRQPKMP